MVAVDAASLVRLCLPIRDMSQSENGNVLDISHDVLVRDFYPVIGEFNRAGRVQIDAVETPCGAQPQVDVFRGRSPLETMRRIHGAMPKEVMSRILIRGPFGVGLSPLHRGDLYFMLRQLAIASGAADGRRVLFKLFEAQNNPDEKLASIRILRMLKAEGLDLSLEDATCFTSDPLFPSSHYRDVMASSLLRVKEEFLGYETLLSAVSIKDMIGGLDARILGREGAVHEDASVYAKAVGELLTDDDAIVAIHSHHTGHSAEAYAAAIQASLEEGKTIRVDVLPGGTSFALVQDVFSHLELLGVGALLTDEQTTILERMAGALHRVREIYADTFVDAAEITPEQRRRVKIPGGAVPSTIQLFIKPLAATLDISESDATARILRFMEQAWHDLGKPHSVTPGAKYLGQTAFLLAKEEARLQREGLDAPHHQLYASLTPELLHYWRGAMPSSPDPDVFRVLCRRHLMHVLPQILPGEELEILREHLIAKPDDKAHARKMLEGYGYGVSPVLHSLFEEGEVTALLARMEQLAFVSGVPMPTDAKEDVVQQREVCREELHQIFARRGFVFSHAHQRREEMVALLDHVGRRERSVSAMVEERLPVIRAELDKLRALGISLTDVDNAAFAALLMPAASQGRLDLAVQQLLLMPREHFPSVWRGAFSRDPGFACDEQSSRLYGEQIERAGLFWRTLAQQIYLRDNVSALDEETLFLEALGRVEEPNVREMVMAKRRIHTKMWGKYGTLSSY